MAEREEKNHGGLVITRKAGESVFIGDSIEVTITRIGSNRVHLQIKAPSTVKILREELINPSQAILTNPQV